jgi:hypothetical protein
MRERDLQAAVAMFLAHALPVDAVAHHSSNEGKRGWQAQRDFKSSGARAGWPDIEIMWQGRAYFIELKAPKKYPTPEQRAVHAQLKAAGCPVVTVRSLAEVEMTLRHWAIPVKGRVAA